MEIKDLPQNPVQRLSTVRQFCNKNPAFTQQGIYTIMFKNMEGFNESGAVLRIGRKVFLDEVKFYEWLRKINNLG